jgi:hypothetical protein
MTFIQHNHTYCTYTRAFIPVRSGFRFVKVTHVTVHLPSKHIASFETFPAQDLVRITGLVEKSSVQGGESSRPAGARQSAPLSGSSAGMSGWTSKRGDISGEGGGGGRLAGNSAGVSSLNSEGGDVGGEGGGGGRLTGDSAGKSDGAGAGDGGGSGLGRIT